MKTSQLLRPLLNYHPIKPLPFIYTRLFTTIIMPFETKATIKTFGGHLLKLSHPSTSPSPPANSSNTPQAAPPAPPWP
jgi:hypothetical protein